MKSGVKRLQMGRKEHMKAVACVLVMQTTQSGLSHISQLNTTPTRNPIRGTELDIPTNPVPSRSEVCGMIDLA